MNRTETERTVLREVRSRLLDVLDENGGEPFIRIEVSGNKGLEGVVEFLTAKLCGGGAVVRREPTPYITLGEFPRTFTVFIGAPTLVKDEQRGRWSQQWEKATQPALPS